MKKFNFKDSFNIRKNTKVKVGILIFICVILGVSIFSISRSLTEEQVEVKSVEIKSDGWDDEEPGAWKITKSAEWTGLNRARITMDLETLPKFIEVNAKYDVVFALDVSTSMAGEKFDALKVSLKKYLAEVLKDTDNRIAFTEYHTYGSVLSEFTNNYDKLSAEVDKLQLKCDPEIINGVAQDYGYCTNYYEGLKNVEKVLEGYVPEEGRQLTVLFLTDGSANNDLGLIKGQYQDLKDKYPNMIIHGIKYEMGSTINHYLKLASDDQYDAYVDDIYDKFFVATYADVLARYEKLDITDYISEYFYTNSINDIEVNKGSIEFDEETQKIVWNVASGTFMSGQSAKMTIDVNVKEPYSGINGYYPTNKGEDINSKLREDEEIFTESKLTPVLKNFYNVVYDSNTPSNCDLKLIESETHFVYENVVKRSDELACDGYVFNGWEITDETSIDVDKISEETFIMPEHDVTIKAVWGTLDIDKTMEGSISNAVCKKFPLTGEIACVDNLSSEFVTSTTGIDFKLYSSDTNGKGLYIYTDESGNIYNPENPIYYYRGAVTNNNIIFAGFCWKIVRTTETGGIKLIYNGAVTSGNTCNSTIGTGTQISTSAFNSTSNATKYMGYTYDYNASTGKATDSTIKGVIDRWYKTNIQDKNFSDYLEDTVWCTDRSNPTTGTKNSTTGNSYTSYTFYGFGTRNLNYEYIGNKPLVTCPTKEDSHTVDSTNGNGLLTYPVAMLTADEAQMAGYAFYSDNNKTYNTTTYLHTGQYFWLLSPGNWGSSYAGVTYVYSNGNLGYHGAGSSGGIRPSVSLKLGTTITTSGSGEEGSATNPYIVEG